MDGRVVAVFKLVSARSTVVLLHQCAVIELCVESSLVMGKNGAGAG